MMARVMAAEHQILKAEAAAGETEAALLEFHQVEMMILVQLELEVTTKEVREEEQMEQYQVAPEEMVLPEEVAAAGPGAQAVGEV